MWTGWLPYEQVPLVPQESLPLSLAWIITVDLLKLFCLAMTRRQCNIVQVCQWMSLCINAASWGTIHVELEISMIYDGKKIQSRDSAWAWLAAWEVTPRISSRALFAAIFKKMFATRPAEIFKTIFFVTGPFQLAEASASVAPILQSQEVENVLWRSECAYYYLAILPRK